MAPNFARPSSRGGHRTSFATGRRPSHVNAGRKSGSRIPTQNGTEKTFSPTRVAVSQDDPSSDESLQSEAGIEPDLRGNSDSSSEEEDGIDGNIVKPYGELLQSLSAEAVHSEPPKKKRKVSHSGSPTQELPVDESDTDRAEVSEETDDTDFEDAIPDDSTRHDDPFVKHLNGFQEEELAARVEAIGQGKWSVSKLGIRSAWSQTIKVPMVHGASSDVTMRSIESTEELSLKQKLKVPGMSVLPSFDDLTGDLACSMFNYRDVLFTGRTSSNGERLRNTTCLHILNHVYKTRDLVIKGNARLSREDAGEGVEIRDQGFTRPKVIVLLPTRQACARYIEAMIRLCEPEQQENKSRFQSSYATGTPASADKPIDFRELFDGNDNDMFRIGLKFTRKSLKFFAQFYNSDVILASPLGLRMALGSDDKKKYDSDFLSSIEILVMDQSEAIAMQNWEHVLHILDQINLQPKEAHGCDFSRVRHWYLDGNAKYLRQTILLSAFNFPALTRLWTKHMLNIAGKVIYSHQYEGAIVDRSLTVKQTFSRFEANSPAIEPDNRFKYFTTAIVPSLAKNAKSNAAISQGCLVFIPSYADFVRVRNYLATSNDTQNISFGSISEYSSVREIARARSHFLSGRHSVLLYTERAHHFRRYRLKGVKKVIMYGLPENSTFYTEIVGGFLNDAIAAAQLDRRNANVRILFSKLDIMKLERTVGTQRYLALLKSDEGDTFEFASADQSIMS